MRFEYPPGATPVDPDEAAALIPGHIATMGQLNEWEQANILNAEAWAYSRKRPELLALSFVQELHRQMFKDTWEWAGRFRHSDKNIGAPWPLLPEMVRNVCDDASAWIEFGSYPPVEGAVRLHLRLVQVHPFPNGNGRHARLMADLALFQMDLPRLTWGSADLTQATHARDVYIAALKAADNGDIEPLLRFAVS